MFGSALFFERDPLRYRDLPALFVSWVQDAGGFAMVAVVLWLLFGYVRMRPEDKARIPGWMTTVFLWALVGAAVAYVAALGTYLAEYLRTGGIVMAEEPATPADRKLTLAGWCVFVGGALALVAAGLPLLRGLFALRFRRIYALAKLSFKEAIRRRVLWAFAGFLLVFLFGSWFIPSKHEDQVRNYVDTVATSMTILLLAAAAILAAFSIPADVKQQTIHTIVTKPVERFEIVLGRFLGFAALMTLVLLFMTTVSLIYVARGVDPEAAEESLKAREPFYGELEYENTADPKKGINVGREWEYRGYISGPMPGAKPEYAVWNFEAPPRGVLGQDSVRCEFGFDVYRTTKGYENKGVSCTFAFQTWRFRPGDDQKYKERRRALLADQQQSGKSEAAIDNELAKEFGYYEKAGKEVVDYHTQYLDLPVGLFENALDSDPERRKEIERLPNKPPGLQVRVRCNSPTQYVGMAKYDMYLRLDDPRGTHDRLRFAWNFYKGTFGLWLLLCLVVGLAVALSTYLSGVITLILVVLLLLGGLGQDFIKSVGAGTNIGGGPAEAFLRLVRREVAAAPMEETTTNKVATASDVGFRWFVRRILDVLPDMDRFYLFNYVGQGFNIPLSQLVIDFLLLAGYLLPWAVLAYYLIKWREIASSM
jgi:ABC-type transport system involved in multi-copper enzyme maturation permease subunit